MAEAAVVAAATAAGGLEWLLGVRSFDWRGPAAICAALHPDIPLTWLTDARRRRADRGPQWPAIVAAEASGRAGGARGGQAGRRNIAR